MPDGWHRADIIAAIHKRGSNLARLSRENGYANSTLRAALIKPTIPANSVIASFLGLTLHELWPAWFDAQGRRNPATTRQRPSSRKRAADLSLTRGER